MKHIISVVFFLILCFGVICESQAQASRGKIVEGMVVDSLGMGLKGVNVLLTSALDTLYTVTNNQGTYRLRGIKSSLVHLSYTMLGRQETVRSIFFNNNVDYVNPEQVVMYPGISNIDPIQINRATPILYKEDTTIYNMPAFTYMKNALLEDVLRNNLPGFNVLRDGTTFHNGRIIRSVQVDGHKFFGGDVMTATKNLPADYIDQIEVINYYGDMSEAKGIKDTEPETIINIILKEDKKKITFGQVTAGGGTSDRYLGSVGLNKFNSGQELSVVASVNNTNTSLFTFGAPNGSGGRPPNLSDIGDYADQADGLNKVTSLGVNFSDDITQRTRLTGGYSYTQRENETVGNSLLTSTYDYYRISKRDDYITLLDDRMHRFNLELNTRFKNNDYLKISPSLIVNRHTKDNIRENTLRNFRLTNRGTYQDSSVTDNPQGQLNVLYSKYFKKDGRKLVGDFNVNFNSMQRMEDVAESYQIFDTTGGTPVQSAFAQQQIVRQFNDSRSANAAVSYVEPFFDHSLLEISYEYDLTEIEMSRRVRVPEPDRMIPVDSLGLNYEYRFSSNRTSLTYQYEPNNRFRTNIGFAVQPLNLVGNVANDTISHSYSNINLVPSASIRYRFTDDLDVQFSYNGRNNQPNFLHISPVRDNTNSRHIIVGNPSLKAEFLNRLSAALRKSIISRAQYLELNVAYHFTNNKIVPSKRAMPGETVQETTFTNTDGYYEFKGYYTFNTPFVHEELNLDISGNLDYFNNIVYINDSRSTTKQYLFSKNIQLRYQWDQYFESVFNTNYFLNHATFELPRKDRVSAHSVLFSLGGRGYLSDKLMMGVEMSQKYFRGNVADITDVSPTIINTYLEYSFMKNKMALLRLQCFDLLDENKNVGVVTEYVGNDVYESRNNRLGRYFMLTLNMRLQKLPKSK